MLIVATYVVDDAYFAGMNMLNNRRKKFNKNLFFHKSKTFQIIQENTIFHSPNIPTKFEVLKILFEPTDQFAWGVHNRQVSASLGERA